MRKLFYLLIAMLVLMSCGNGSKKKNEENKAEEIQPNRIEVLYFPGAQRCFTCRAIEAITVALLDSLYSQEKANGKIIYKVVDISKKENEAIGMDDLPDLSPFRRPGRLWRRRHGNDGRAGGG